MTVAHTDQVDAEGEAKLYDRMVLVYLFLGTDQPSF